MLFFASLESLDISHKKVADAFPSYGQKFILQGDFASQVFSNKKKCNFQGQILNVHIFSPIDGGTTILTGYWHNEKAFQKKKSFWFNLNQSKYIVIFVKIPIFQK